MPILKLGPSATEEELFYRKHIFDSLGKEQGEKWLNSIDNFRTDHGLLPALVEAEIQDVLHG